MARRKARKVEAVPEEVQEEVVAPPQREIVVLEYYGPVEDLETEVKQAHQGVQPGGALYLTIPYALARQAGYPQVTDMLMGLFSQVGSLNVGTNPKLENNNTHERVGFLCLK
jgi:hypothetical protein